MMRNYSPERAAQRAGGVFYTPGFVVEYMIEQVLPAGSPLRILDPACGEGAFLAALARRLGEQRGLYGVDLDEAALAAARRALPGAAGNLRRGDALSDQDFCWEREFPEVMAAGGFDLVIGNPPYVLLRDAEQQAYLRERYVSAAYKIDAYHLFMERAIRLTRPGGRVALITPANFMTNNHLTALRRLLLEQTRVDLLLLIEGGVFPGVSVDNVITVATVGAGPSLAVPLRRARCAGAALVVGGETTLSGPRILASERALLTGGAGHDDELWPRLRRECLPLGAVAHVNFGKQLRDRRTFVRDVVQVGGLEEVEAGYVPCYTGRDVRRYELRWGGLACLLDEGARRGGCWDRARQGARGKLITRQIGAAPAFALDGEGHHCLNTVFMVNVKDERVDVLALLAILNSALLRGCWLETFGDGRRTFPKIKGRYLELLPVWPQRAQPALIRHLAQLAALLIAQPARADLNQEVDEGVKRLFGA